MTDQRFNHRWDADRDAQLTELWNAGIALADIAMRMRTTVAAIGDRRAVLGLPPRRGPSGWTPERIELVKRRWAEGRSATQISIELGCGLSRNAVIGMVNRQGWSALGRAPAACPAPNMRKRQITAPKVARSHVRPPKPGPQNRPAVVMGKCKTSTPAEKAARAAEGKALNASVAKGVGVESPNARPWDQNRKPTECSWPIGNRYEIKSCCNPVHARGWCKGHYEIGTVPTPPVRPRAAVSLARFDGIERVRPSRPANDERVWTGEWAA